MALRSGQRQRKEEGETLQDFFFGKVSGSLTLVHGAPWIGYDCGDPGQVWKSRRPNDSCFLDLVDEELSRELNCKEPDGAEKGIVVERHIWQDKCTEPLMDKISSCFLVVYIKYKYKRLLISL
jgi:hypothetical protein